MGYARTERSYVGAVGSEPGVPAPREIVLTDEFRQALALLAGGKHLFLTGKAGTGKSTLIRRFMAETDRNVVVVAPTGIAALNVDGYTIHRLFGFRATTTLHDVRGGGYRPGRFTKTLASLDTLIIDEASMVRADVFDMLAAALERFGPAPGQPFGGVQIVLVGDLYQLPPVVTEGEAAFFSTTYETPYFFSANSFRRDDFPTVALTTVFRQLGDDRMTAILNEIREGVLLGHAQEQLNARTDPDFVPPEDEFWLTLAPTNRLVSARNRQQLDRLPGSEVVHRARVSGDLSLFDPPADDVLRFKVGAQIMMLNNDQGHRWVNGTIGRVVGVDERVAGSSSPSSSPTASAREVTPFTWEATRPWSTAVRCGGGDRNVHAVAVQAGVGDHHPQEPGADAGPVDRRPDRWNVLHRSALRRAEPVHVDERAGAETACAAEGFEDRPPDRPVPTERGAR